MRYYAQDQAPAGNWVDLLGSDDLDTVVRYANYCRAQGKAVRVIERVDTVVTPKAPKAIKPPRCESGWTGDRCTKVLDHKGPHSNQ